ncbi:MAG: malto-oligosyltrehalose trehalohydrolase, partial [Deltaproteobacteria bacterium]|nr:malto-oligosyltrehalose trehalohydrolase [Deltaproteobacteria bacterium]
MDDHHHPLGAHADGPTTRFGAYVTAAQTCAVRLYPTDGRATTHPMRPRGGGYFELATGDAPPGTLYRFVLDGRELPDPYARFLPRGVHGPAMVTRAAHAWRHPPVRRPLAGQVIYELHVGAFTPEGTYAAAAERLAELAALGVTTLELMPLAAFAGERGWGYDGVALFAPHAPYGAPDELRAFVDAAHGHGLGVLLDVVYNHLGPAGNYLSAYSADYFTSAARNAWGDAPDFALPAMRSLVLANARYWLEEFCFDGLRLDAVHALVDPSPRHVVAELTAAAHALDPGIVIIGEDDRNDASLVAAGLDGLWADDFHHALHVALTGERDGYYGAYSPGAAEVARAIDRGWIFEGQAYGTSGRPRGTDASALPASAFVYCLQNHDQVGNRALGERLTADVPLDAWCAASAVLLFLPMTPLLFMGQEWAASTPFRYFTDHEPELGALVTAGRREEFKHFRAFSDPAAAARIPDPQAAETFARSRLRWDERGAEPHARVLALYRALLALRRADPVLREATRAGLAADA